MARFYPENSINWHQTRALPSKRFICGFCNTTVASVTGYKLGHQPDGSGPFAGGVYICPNCGGPVFLDMQGIQHPAPVLGNPVENVPKELHDLYEEARRCTGQNCFTASVLLCRKLLMHIAVEKAAAAGLKFIQYVEFLSDKGYVPPNGKDWVDHIRKKGNEATHEIVLMSEDDAKDLLVFSEMLLRFNYEFPNRIPKLPSN